MSRKNAPQSDELFLAIDQGGHASRALVFDGQGRILAQAFRDIETQHPATDRVEHDPEALIGSVTQAIADVAEQLGPHCDQVRAAGLATQRSSIVCWDRNTGQALSPVISWQDRRAAEWLTQFAHHADRIHSRTGLPLSPHYGASKLRWCLDHIPTVRQALQEERLVWGPLASYLLFRLLKERPLLADPANASRTLLWDVHTRDWAPKLLELFSLPREPLPRCVPSRHPYGNLRLGQHWIPLYVATGDQSAALFTDGHPDPETLYANIGTGAFVQRPIKEPLTDPERLLQSVIFQDQHQTQYVLEGTVNGAGSAVEWTRQQLRLSQTAMKKQLAEALHQAQSPILFLNGISGLGSPYWQAQFPSRFIGQGTANQRIGAVLDSILFLLQVNIELLARQRPPPTGIIVTGGLAVEDEFCQRLADLSALPVRRPEMREATARGLAYLVAGCPRHWPKSPCSAHFEPKANSLLEEQYQQWRTHMERELAGNS